MQLRLVYVAALGIKDSIEWDYGDLNDNVLAVEGPDHLLNEIVSSTRGRPFFATAKTMCLTFLRMKDAVVGCDQEVLP